MKTYIFVLGIAVLGVVGASQFGTSTEVINIVEEVEVEPDWATDEEAKQAAQDVIRRKALEADKSRLEGQIEALENELEQVDKELGVY